MEITFQNRLEDFDAFYDYVIEETEQGKIVSSEMHRNRQIWLVVYSALLGSLTWGATGSWKIGLGVFGVLLIVLEAIVLFQSGFNPRHYQAKQSYKRQEKFINPRELQISLLPRTLKADTDWLEISNSETVHRWRWGCVDPIRLTDNFLFIHVGTHPIIYVPKRDFPSQKSFLEFSQNLIELREKNNPQPLGAV